MSDGEITVRELEEVEEKDLAFFKRHGGLTTFLRGPVRGEDPQNFFDQSQPSHDSVLMVRVTKGKRVPIIRNAHWTNPNEKATLK